MKVFSYLELATFQVISVKYDCSFQSSYPSWEPNNQGKQLISTLKAFREKKLQVHERISSPYLPPRMQQWSPESRGHGDINNVFSGETLHNIPEMGYQLGSLWLFDSDQKNYLNILEWYYTSEPQLANEAERDAPSRSSNVAESTKNFWMSSPMIDNEATHDENWGQLFDSERLQSHLEASTATPLFHGSVLHHDDSINAAHYRTRSHWWARSNAQGNNAQASFLEPPLFNRNTDNYYDNVSDRSIIEEEQDHFELTRSQNTLSRTFYLDDLDGGQFNLPFDDIYSRHSTSPEPDPLNFV